MIEKLQAPVLGGDGPFDGPALINPRDLMTVFDDYGKKINEVIEAVNRLAELHDAKAMDELHKSMRPYLP